MDPIPWRLALVPLVASSLGLGACASTPSRFYLLNALATPETIPSPATSQGPVIGVGPITMPRYVDRPQIVTRVGRNQLALGEFDRWAEPLQNNVSRHRRRDPTPCLANSGSRIANSGELSVRRNA
jgi:uncharacterized lipoprotein YmbA